VYKDSITNFFFFLKKKKKERKSAEMTWELESPKKEIIEEQAEK